MEAIQYVRSIPRYLTARFLGSHWERLYTSGWACLRLTQVEPPRLPSQNWVRIKPVLSGICGSDLATLTARGSTYFSPFTSTPFVLGHEVIGLVQETGTGVEGIQIGDRVVLEPPLHCEIREVEPRCSECLAKRQSHCLSIQNGVVSAGIQTGFCRDTGGGWSHGLVAHRKQLRKLPPDLKDEEAILIEPFSCCLQAARIAPLSNNKTVLILGCGTMGLLSIAAIRALQSGSRIVAVAKYAHQQQAALRLGADTVVGAGRNLAENLAAALKTRLFHPEIGRPSVLAGADICFDCVGSERTIDDAMRFTSPRGTVVMVGMPSIPGNVDWTAMWYKELKIVGSYSFDSSTFDRSLELIMLIRRQLGGFVGAEFPLSDFRQAIRTALHSGSEGVIKVAFRIG